MWRKRILILVVLVFVLLLAGDAKISSSEQLDTIRFAIIGDYGSGGPGAAAVANMVKGWNPDFIITTGDNNYPAGQSTTIDQNIGQFYHEYIYPYVGNYGPGASYNRFFPTLGNHDWMTPGAQPYLDYFTLPGNERYYDFIWGPVHFFALDNNYDEPDGFWSTSIQGLWLQARLSSSTAPWKLVYTHVSPYSSGLYDPNPVMQWPFDDWGATTLVSAHDHVYERLLIDDFVYFVNGLGGDMYYEFDEIIPSSMVQYNAASGAILVEASSESMTFQFFSVVDGGTLVDSYTFSQIP